MSIIVPSLTSPPLTAPKHSKRGCPTLVNTSGCTPLQLNRCTETKKYETKEQIKTPEKELSDKETGNLPDAEFKTLVIRMLTELIELSHKMKEEMKATQGEIKQNIQGNNSEWKETGTQKNNLEQKEEINIHT